ncbi:hypothetical protein [Serratia silvae]|uniref:Uncharacterized protein n=1 Tax=Serratia silvae TaxID=2824122 RepID=A0ABT0KAJ2_9GAMM|nr:hypothetical protein [Serratia silvae]MCL1028807.1 hypothetical protein [Serratia silvae]
MSTVQRSNLSSWIILDTFKTAESEAKMNKKVTKALISKLNAVCNHKNTISNNKWEHVSNSSGVPEWYQDRNKIKGCLKSIKEVLNKQRSQERTKKLRSLKKLDAMVDNLYAKKTTNKKTINSKDIKELLVKLDKIKECENILKKKIKVNGSLKFDSGSLLLLNKNKNVLKENIKKMMGELNSSSYKHNPKKASALIDISSKLNKTVHKVVIAYNKDPSQQSVEDLMLVNTYSRGGIVSRQKKTR